MTKAWAFFIAVTVGIVATADVAITQSSHAPATSAPESLIGTWRGTSTCTDRVAAPACNDEAVVYEFTAGDKPGVVHWKADKVVNGQREEMGAFDLTYDKADACWKAEFKSPQLSSLWRVVVVNGHLAGSAELLPTKQMIRKIDAQRSR